VDSKQAPSARPGVAISGYQSGHSRARWVVATALVTIAVTLFEFGADAAQVRVAARILSGQIVALNSVAATDTYVRVTYIVSEVALLVPFLVFLFWLHRAATNASVFARELRFTPGWAVGWFFVPFANLVRPARVVNEIWQTQDVAPVAATRVGRSVLRISPLIPVWWGLWILDIGGLGGRLLGVVYSQTNSLADIRNATYLDMAYALVVIASLLATIRLVRRMDAREAAKAALLATQAAEAATAARIARNKRAGKTARLALVPAVTAVDLRDSRTPRRLQRVMTATVGGALVVAPLALAFAVSNGTSAKSAAPAQTPTPAAIWTASNTRYTSCSDAMFQPAGVVTAGATSTCGHIAIGASLFSADCTTGKIPTTLSSAVFDSTGGTSTLGSVKGADGSCELSAKSTSVTTAVFAGNGGTNPASLPGSIVVVADFIPTANTAGVTTIGLRVNANGEFDIELGSGGDYTINESAGTLADQLLQGDFTGDPVASPNLATPVRVVVYLKGSTAAAFVDGRLIGTGPTIVPNQPGGCGFSLSSSNVTKATVTKLLSLEVFAAG
jgi:hypothetical protein